MQYKRYWVEFHYLAKNWLSYCVKQMSVDASELVALAPTMLLKDLNNTSSCLS